jgi:hypothetical protein
MAETSFRGWPRVTINTGNGDVDAIAPIIISASRATDIPAFYADWFVHRLRAGYVKWVNRFNGMARHVSFERARVVVFWTKNAAPMLGHLPEFDARGINYYFTFTVNDYAAEGLEPKVPPLTQRVDTFRMLSERIGRQKVLWRFDPLILTDRITVERLLDKIHSVGNKIRGHTEKLIISFIDINRYRKVRQNLLAAGVGHCREFTPDDIARMAAGLQAMSRQWGLEVATCAEAEDLSGYGIKHNKCIDDELMIRLFGDDRELMGFVGHVPPEDAVLPFAEKEVIRTKALKDPGQRKDCGCIPSKDIGQYDTCVHSCLYCYANTSPKVAERNYERYTREGQYHESILGD